MTNNLLTLLIIKVHFNFGGEKICVKLSLTLPFKILKNKASAAGLLKHHKAIDKKLCNLIKDNASHE